MSETKIVFRDLVEYRNMCEVLKPGREGGVVLEKKTITPEHVQMARLRDLMKGTREFEGQEPGDYMVLTVDGEVVMSDTQMERRTNDEFVRNARGRVLIGGLGMGVVLFPLVQMRRCTEIVVLERDKRVIDLIWPQLGPKLEPPHNIKIIRGDVFTYPGRRWYDTVYMDIWPTISPDNWPEMNRLMNKYSHRVRVGGWMGCWRQEECHAMYQLDEIFKDIDPDKVRALIAKSGFRWGLGAKAFE